jgi:hypothetical protein
MATMLIIIYKSQIQERRANLETKEKLRMMTPEAEVCEQFVHPILFLIHLQQRLRLALTNALCAPHIPAYVNQVRTHVMVSYKHHHFHYSRHYRTPSVASRLCGVYHKS